MHGIQLETMLARTQWEERERRVQQHLLEQQFIKVQAERNAHLPRVGFVQRFLRAVGWRSSPGSAHWSARQELTEA